MLINNTFFYSFQASVALSDWCLDNSELFKNKTILELGSGVGVTGIILGSVCFPKRICLTDCHSAVLEVLCENVTINSANLETEQLETPCESLLLKKHTNNGSVVEVYKLLWENIDEKVCKKFGEVELVIAADVVYDSDLFVPLANALRCFLICGTSEVLLACTERNKNTLDHFFAILSKLLIMFI